MLNKDQMELIRQEEVFREEVRKDIEKKRSSASRRGKLWSFLNSSFGIWLLSSVVLGSLGFLYGYIQDTWRVKRDAQERVSRLRFEIPTHGLDFLHSLESAHDYTDYSNLFVAHLQRPQYKLSDFKEATMDQLLWEYRHLAKDPTEANSAQKAIDWIWADIDSIRSEIRLDRDKKQWLDGQIDASIRELFLPPVADKHP